MPWTFLNPGLLLGALAAGVPLLLHLLQNRRPRRVPFSDLTFLREVSAHRARSLGIRRWLLLLVRMLAIVLLAVGAARPRLGGLAPGEGDRASLLILIDASASMQTQDAEGVTRFRHALDAAHRLTAGLDRRGEVQWMLAGARTRPVFGDWLPAAAVADRPPEDLVPTDGRLDLAAALTAAAAAVDGARSRPVIVFIGDGRPPADAPAALGAAAAELQARGVDTVELVSVGAATANGGVRELQLPARHVRPGDRLELAALAVSGREDQAFQLVLDGRVQAEAVAGTGVGGVTELAFAATAPGTGLHAGYVRTDHDAFEADDRRPFLLDVRPRLRVLLVHGDAPGTGGRGGWRYLARALAPDTSRTGPVDLRAVRQSEWREGDLPDYDVVVLADAGSPGRARLDALGAWLEGGGRLWLMLGDPADAAAVREHLLPRLAGVDDATFRTLSDAAGERWRTVAGAHPILDGLPPEALATLAESRWRRVWSLRAPDLETVAELEGGDPLLLAGARGRGRLVLQTASLGPEASDLARSAMALPLVQRVAGWLAAGRAAPPVLEAGRPLTWTAPDPRALGAEAELEPVLWHRPAREREPVRAYDVRVDWQESRPVIHGPADPPVGHWFLVAGGDTLAAAVTVLPASEVEPATPPLEPVELLAGTGLRPGGSLGDASASAVGAALSGRDLTVWFLLAAALLLLWETRLARGEG
ncbi:MAG TPA: BatA domain-containing protein [Candidatus Krumholzibacteria bacterium]|nr:BatA domain-containing protein [Candidatus Krumholzibacteria bacterium]